MLWITLMSRGPPPVALLRPPLGVVIVLGLEHRPQHRNANQVAQLATGERLADAHTKWREPAVMADQDGHAGPVNRGNHLVGVVQCARDGFFHQDRQPSLQALDRDGRVQMVGDGHDHTVEFSASSMRR